MKVMVVHSFFIQILLLATVLKSQLVGNWHHLEWPARGGEWFSFHADSNYSGNNKPDTGFLLYRGFNVSMTEDSALWDPDLSILELVELLQQQVQQQV